MPRLKQQRPRHIVEDDPDEEQTSDVETPSSDQNDITSTTMNVPPHDMPCGSGTENNCCSMRPGGSENAVSERNGEQCGDAKREDTADDGLHSRSSPSEKDFGLDGTGSANTPFVASKEATATESVGPFVTLQQPSPQSMTRESPKVDPNTKARLNDNEFINAILSQSIRNARNVGRENGETISSPTARSAKNGASDSRWPVVLQNTLVSPLQLMAKLLYESRVDNMLEAEESLRGGGKTEKKIPVDGPTDMTSTLYAIRNQILDKRNDFSAGGGGRLDCERALTASGDSPASLGSGKSSSPRRAPANAPGNMFHQFLPSEEPLSREKRSPNSATCAINDGVKKSERADSVETDNNVTSGVTQLLPLPWRGVSPLALHSGRQIARSASSPQDEHHAKARLPSPRDDTKHTNAGKRDSSASPVGLGLPTKSSTCERPSGPPSVSPKSSSQRYKSPLPLWATHRQAMTGTPYQRYVNGSRQRDPHLRGPDKILAPYGYSPMLVAPHAPPFTFPMAPLSEYSAMSASPYYSPWAMMYPPVHPGIDGMAANPLFQSLQAETRALRNGSVPKSPPGVSPPRPSSNPAYSVVRKPAVARSKPQPTNPIDMYHAAIVREAKEANKGMDPENMYIECPICHKKIKRLYHFQRHMRIHSGEKSHACPYCPYKSVRKDNLKSHLKTHEKSKYDAPRRMPQKHENLPKAAFPPTPEFHVSSYPGKSISRSPAGAPPPFLSFGPRSLSGSPPSSLRRPSGENPPLEFRAPKHSAHPILRDMALLSTAGYRPEGKLGFPYSAFPSVSPFLGLPPRSCASSSCITEIEDESPLRRASSKSPNSALPLECQNGEVSPRKRPKTPDTLADSPPPEKRSKEAPSDRDENLLVGNLNNSNNSDSEPPVLVLSPPKSDGQLAPGPFVKEPSVSFVDERNRGETIDNTTCTSESVPREVATPKKDVRAPFEENYKLFVGQNGELQQRLQHLATTLGLGNLAARKTESAEIRKDRSSRETDSKNDDQSKNRESTGDFKPRGSPISAEEQRYKTSESTAFEETKAESLPVLGPAENLVPKTEPRGTVTSSSEATYRHNSGGVNAPWMGVVSRESKCRLCDFAAPSNASLQEHMTTHKEYGLYKCQQCDYHGKNLSKLIEHIRIHTGERPFQCDQCNYAAKRKDNLAQHKSVRHVKNRVKGPARVVKLAPDDPAAPGKGREGSPPRRNSQYASVLVAGSQPLSLKGAEARRPFCGSEWFAKLGDGILPVRFSGDKSPDEVIQNRTAAMATSDYSASSAFRPRVYPFQSFFSYGNMTS